MSSEDYLAHLDRKLGMLVGTIYGMCVASVSHRSIGRDECRVTYKGLTSRSVKVNPGRFMAVQKKVFLIEGNETDEGRKVLAQVFLSMSDTAEHDAQLVAS